MANTKKTNSTKSTKKTTTTKNVAPKNATKNSSTKKEVKKVETKKDIVEKVEPKKETIKTEKKVVKNNSNFFKENYRMIVLCIVCVLLIINIVLIVMGHKVKLSDGKEIIASVDGKEITAEELFDRLKEKNGSDTLISMIDEFIITKEDIDEAEAKKEAQSQIDSIKSQYESAGYNWNEVLSQYGYESEDVLLNEFLLSIQKEMVVKKQVKETITDSDIESYYNDNVYDTYTVKHILIKVNTNDEMSDEDKEIAEQEASNKAYEVIDRLNNGEDWATLVNEYSEDEGSKEEEGLIENFTHGDVVDEFFNASASLEDGQYSSEPVKSEYGYHIILKVSSTAKKELKDMKDEIIDTLVENKLSEDSTLFTNTWKDIRKKYKLAINDTTIKNAYEKTNE